MNMAIAVRDVKVKLAQAINDSQLPPCVLEPIINNIHQQVIQAATAELKQAEEELQNAESN